MRSLKDIVFFLPVRKGSERVINKNTRPFYNINGGLFELKIRQLLSTRYRIPIYISTNDESAIKIAKDFENDNIKIIVRPDNLCQSNTRVEDFIKYIPTIFDSNKHVFWLHATSPFVDHEIYDRAIELYLNQSNNYDSMMSVSKIQQFIWDPNKSSCINYDQTKIKWPRTQDLDILYEINHAFYINSIENFNTLGDRIGKRPYLFELNKLQSFDIDWQDDFEIAEKIYKSIEKA